MMRHILRAGFGLLLILAVGKAYAQPNTYARVPLNTTTPTNTGAFIPSTAIFCADGAGNAQVCSFGGGGGGGSNASVGTNGSTSPSSSTLNGFTNGSGLLTAVSPTNPLPITGSISATNPSVQTNGSTGATSSTLNGYLNGSGNQTAVSPTNVFPTGDVALDAIISGGKLSVSAGSIGIAQGGNQAAVTAASTAPTATQPALVVTQSPNGSEAPPYSGTPSACTASTVGTSATLILDSVANGVGRNGGGFVLPATATAPVEYQWSNSSTGLTTTVGGTVLQVLAGGVIPFSGAPNTQLYAISTSSQVASCLAVK